MLIRTLTHFVAGIVVTWSLTNACHVQAQNLILNGSFESPVIASNSFQSATPTDWIWLQTPAYIHNGNSGQPSVWPLPEDGNQYADIGDDPSYALSQSFTISSSNVYTVSWFDSSGHNGLTTAPYTATISNATTLVFTVSLDAYHSTFGAWSNRTYNLVLTNGSYSLAFQSQNVFNGLDSLIDNVTLVPMTTTGGPVLAQNGILTRVPDVGGFDSVTCSGDGTKLATTSYKGPIFVSTNSGATWMPASTPETNDGWGEAPLASSANGSTLLADDYNFGTCISTNWGVTWTVSHVPNSDELGAVAFSADGTKAVGIGAAGIYTSSDSGFDWQITSAPSVNWNSVASSSNGTKLVLTTDGGGIYISTNSGTSWAPTTASTAISWGEVASSSDGSKLVTIGSTPTNAEIYLSADSGASWQVANAPGTNWLGVACSSDGTKLAATLSGGPIYGSTNSGMTWTAVFSDGAGGSWDGAIASSSDGSKLIAGSDSVGIFVYGSISPVTNDWVQTVAPPADSVVSSSDGTKLVANGSDGEIYRSTNSGVDWQVLSSQPGAPVVISSWDGTKLVAIGDNVYTSSNSGSSWTLSSAALTNWSSFTSSSNCSKLTAVGDNGIYVSANFGGSWAPAYSNLADNSWDCVASSPDGITLLAGLGDGGIYISTNGGTSWAITGAPGYGWSAVSTSADGRKLAAASPDFGIYVSTNSGTTWYPTTAPNDLNWVSLVSSADGTKLAAFDQNYGVFLSTDSGAAWTLSTGWLTGFFSIASSADGTKLAVVGNTNALYGLTGIFTYDASDPPPIRITSSAFTAPGQFQIQFNANVGASYEVLAAPNLAMPLSNWTMLGSVTVPTSYRVFDFLDTRANSSPNRFYCIRSP